MSLPEFNTAGDLPVGLYRVAIEEVVERFGGGSNRRTIITRRLLHIYDLAFRTGYLLRFVIFGSYVTNKWEPNDVDLILVMSDEFSLAACPRECLGLFDHSIAQARYGASIFWTRPSSLISEPLDEFITSWQIKRDKTRRGILDVIHEPIEGE